MGKASEKGFNLSKLKPKRGVIGLSIFESPRKFFYHPPNGGKKQKC